MKLTDTQIKLAEQLLLSVIRHESVIEYNELAIRIDPPIFWRQVGKEIGEVSKLCKELELPLLSAKVVSRGQQRAGIGFYNLMTELGIDIKGKPEKELFSQELKKIRECKEWYKLADYLNLNLDLPRPAENNENHINSSIKTTLHNDSFQPKKLEIQSIKTSWLIPSNSDYYDVWGAFQRFNEIDWRQTVNYQPGDMIFIYCAKPYQRIMIQTEVQRVQVPFKEMIDDREFWIDSNRKEDVQNYTYARLRLIKSVDTEMLSLRELLGNGLKTAPQGPMRVTGQLEAYIVSAFEHSTPLQKMTFEILPLPEEIVDKEGETFTEGVKKQIIVNAYERNAIARSRCIQIHGSKCIICGFDFGAYYGSDFEGKIHIHHIKPLHLIDDTYEVNPEHDLVPVCPNCHLVLHSKQGDVFSVEEVRQMVAKHLK